MQFLKIQKIISIYKLIDKKHEFNHYECYCTFNINYDEDDKDNVYSKLFRVNKFVNLLAIINILKFMKTEFSDTTIKLCYFIR